MKHVVVVEKSRPHLMGYWESHPVSTIRLVNLFDYVFNYRVAADVWASFYGDLVYTCLQLIS